LYEVIAELRVRGIRHRYPEFLAPAPPVIRLRKPFGLVTGRSCYGSRFDRVIPRESVTGNAAGGTRLPPASLQRPGRRIQGPRSNDAGEVYGVPLD
jgi:hypothetical protein